ncbi:MAG: prepilin-type N-terminal cleavage/methylation domain-containing protein [Hydrogenophaga sp.]|nr:prepilin-type N-terminal cleavage/methylation domain-containing protein [Hydrogenophaga sp.]
MKHHFFRVGASAAAGSARQGGFSLIEIALVLVIAGLALGGIVSAIGPQLENKRVSDTQKVLEEVKEALIGFAIVNGRLPRPATSAINGAEMAACATEALCTGLIPWETLGITKLDSWAKIIRYSVTPAFATTVGLTTATNGTKIVQTRNAAGTLTNLATQVPAVLFSSGKLSFGTTDGGVVIPTQSAANTNADEIANNGASLTFIQRPVNTATTVAGGEFDDIVIWLPKTTLVSRLAQAGKPLP